MLSLPFLLKTGVGLLASATHAFRLMILPSWLGGVDGGGSLNTNSHHARILSPEQIEAFKRDGYILLKGLLSDDELNGITRAADSIVAQHHRSRNSSSPFYTFSVMEKGMIFSSPKQKEDGGSMTSAALDNETCQNPMDTFQIVQAFRQVAIRSKLKQVAAELMQLDPRNQNVRILRDVFLAKPVDSSQLCDWHVDDLGFWPAQFVSSASASSGKDQDGINVWLSLDDMPAKYEGSMAVAPGSHAADSRWRAEAYSAIGQNRSEDAPVTIESFASMITNTCVMDQTRPDFRAELEASKLVFDLDRGDAIFATRLLFHRVTEVTPEGREYYGSLGKPTLNRYSIRYVPGTTQLPKGHHLLEWSLLSNPGNMGLALDDVADHDGGTLWFPKVWPTLDRKIDDRLDAVGTDKVPAAKEKALTESQSLGKALQAMREQKEKNE